MYPMDMTRSHVMATAPVTLWYLHRIHPLKKAWRTRNATGMRAKAMNVLTKGGCGIDTIS
jgi:hypothetical protein